MLELYFCVRGSGWSISSQSGRYPDFKVKGFKALHVFVKPIPETRVPGEKQTNKRQVSSATV